MPRGVSRPGAELPLFACGSERVRSSLLVEYYSREHLAPLFHDFLHEHSELAVNLAFVVLSDQSKDALEPRPLKVLRLEVRVIVE